MRKQKKTAKKSAVFPFAHGIKEIIVMTQEL